MPYLFVANTSRQDQRVYYRLDFDSPGTPETQRGRPALHHDIPAGRQVPIGNTDLTVDQCQCVIEQLRPYGAIAHEEVNRTRRRAGLIYNTGKAVPLTAFNAMMDVNHGLLAAEGALRRARAAVTVNKLVEDAAAMEIQRQRFDPEKAPMTGFAVEIEQEDGIGPDGRLEAGFGGGTLDPRGPNAPPIGPPPTQQGQPNHHRSRGRGGRRG